MTDKEMIYILTVAREFLKLVVKSHDSFNEVLTATGEHPQTTLNNVEGLIRRLENPVDGVLPQIYLRPTKANYETTT